jgi:molybdopterin-guanine dinucleotide biosynthesis protein A
MMKEDEASFTGLGPLAGIYSAMNACEAEWYAVVPCDVPLMSEKVFDVLFNRIQQETADGRQPAVIIPVINGRKQPLIGLYHHKTQPVIKELLETGKLKMSDLIECVDTILFEKNDQLFSSRTFTNVNTLNALQDLK